MTRPGLSVIRLKQPSPADQLRPCTPASVVGAARQRLQALASFYQLLRMVAEIVSLVVVTRVEPSRSLHVRRGSRPSVPREQQ